MPILSFQSQRLFRGASTVNQILQELETGGYARSQDFVEAKSAAVCAKIILSEVLNENDA